MEEDYSLQAMAKVRDYYRSRGDMVWGVQTDEPVIALSFDDGPAPVHTLQVLEVLAAYQAQATFFVVGERAKLYPEVLRKTLEQGHELANHTYTHLLFREEYLSASALEDEILRTEEAIRAATGQHPRLFRPPGGYCNMQALRTLIDYNYKMILWSLPQDLGGWKKLGAAHIVDHVLHHARNGDIVMLHDQGEGADQTVEALQHILPALAERGFRFVTVSELLGYRTMNARSLS